MKKIVFLLFIFISCIYSQGLAGIYDSNTKSGLYIETKFNAAHNKDKMIGKTQSAKELVGKRKSINELDLGLYAYDNRIGLKIYGSLWFGNADQYGAGFGIEGKYKPFASIPIALVLGIDEKVGIGGDVFEERNVTLWALNGGAPTMIYFTDDTNIDSTALKFGLEFDISKHFAINVAYVPRWDNYKVKYREVGTPFSRREHEISWHEFQHSVMAGFAVYF
ncbi:MAG: hypothetical protein LBS26_00690 [Campylobacteraceae bacterium]|nr:hypothetical protein [Campylobacteraceae bacterium]